MQFTPTLRALNTIRPVRAPVSVAPLPCAVRRSAPCVCVCNLRAGGSLSRSAAARCPDRPALGAAPTATLRAGCRVRLARIVRACGATKRAIWRNRCAIVRATRRQITVWCNPLLGAAPSRRGYRRSFCPLRGGAAHLRAYARRAMRGESPRAPHPNKTHSWNRPGCIRIVPRDTVQQTGNNHARACQSGGIPPAPRYLPI